LPVDKIYLWYRKICLKWRDEDEVEGNRKADNRSNVQSTHPRTEIAHCPERKAEAQKAVNTQTQSDPDTEKHSFFHQILSNLGIIKNLLSRLRKFKNCQGHTYKFIFW
jgi:hypothetical protein